MSEPTDSLTKQQAFAAMFVYLRDAYNRTGSDVLGGMLGNMSTLPDGRPADPAVWDDWLAAIERSLADKNTPAMRLRRTE